MYTDHKVTSSEIQANNVKSAPSKLVGTEQENKHIFDKLVELFISKYNSLIDELTVAAGNYNSIPPITIDGYTISHSESGVSHGQCGTENTQLPLPGGAFEVPWFITNKYGHIVEQGNSHVILPSFTAYSVTLTSESYTFAGTTQGAIPGEFTTQVTALNGTEQVAISIDLSEVEKPEGVSVSSDGDPMSPTLTISVTEAFVNPGIVKIPVHVGTIVINKAVSLSIAFAGASGGNSVVNTTTTYKGSPSNTTPPEGTWDSTPPHVDEGQYLWTKIVFNYSDGTVSEPSYTVAKQGSTTSTKNIDSFWRYYFLGTVKPAIDDTSVRPPKTGGVEWALTEPTYIPGNNESLYFADCTVFSDNTLQYSEVSLSSSFEAAKLAASTRTHVAYATSPDGTQGFSTTDGGNKTYLGVTVDSNEADPETPESYTWTLIKGADGQPGARGKGITNIVPEYNLSSSNTVANGIWQTSVPSYEANHYYWTRHKIYFDDDTTTYDNENGVLNDGLTSANSSGGGEGLLLETRTMAATVPFPANSTPTTKSFPIAVSPGETPLGIVGYDFNSSFQVFPTKMNVRYTTGGYQIFVKYTVSGGAGVCYPTFWVLYSKE